VTYLDIMRMAMRNKYRLIRYYYTQISKLHTDGGAFYKPLFFEFPDDINATWAQEHNIMLGSALKLSVQSTTLGQNMTDFYFPAGTWCDVFNRTRGTAGCQTFTTGQNVTLETKAWNFYVHLLEGHIVPMQDAALNTSTIADLQQLPVDFHVHASCDSSICSASGEYLNDDGLVLELENNQNVYALHYQHSGGSASLSVDLLAQATHYADSRVNRNDALGKVEIYNAKAQGLDGSFSVTAHLKDGTGRLLGPARYDALADRLVYAGGQDVGLPDLANLTFIRLDNPDL